jgi:FkbM family methyltransferase
MHCPRPWKQALKQAARTCGFDVIRYPDHDAGHARVKLLRHFGIDLVLDVGANTGQYAKELRVHGYNGRLVSFEPLSEPYGLLKAVAAKDPQWVAIHSAVGESAGSRIANVSGNSYSSSILPMLPAHVEADPTSAYVSTEAVSMLTLDSVIDEYWGSGARPFLKIDTQGYEANVLLGATESMPRIFGVQLEMSLVPLYEGSMSFDQSLHEMQSMGFRLLRLEPGFEEATTGRTLQCDGLFFRDLEAPDHVQR